MHGDCVATLIYKGSTYAEWSVKDVPSKGNRLGLAETPCDGGDNHSPTSPVWRIEHVSVNDALIANSVVGPGLGVFTRPGLDPKDILPQPR